ncbi:Ig-like domain-containing protein [Streptomyces sp. NPDC088812]|uniref:Ig-like domain-containing protein n=1 Tax=Streptomyces sp. NPDC088812 TaxID=3365905 RepID=UPI003814096C
MSTPTAPPPAPNQQPYAPYPVYPPQPYQQYPVYPPQPYQQYPAYPPPPPYQQYPMYPPQPYPAYPQQVNFPPPPHKDKTYPQLTAYTVKGTIGGQATTTVKAELLDKNGKPIENAPLTFSIVSGRVLGTKATGGDGIAEVNAGSNILDPLIWIQAAGSGYTVHFSGNEDYMPATATASITPAGN